MNCGIVLDMAQPAADPPLAALDLPICPILIHG